jgi:hypothetical protein
MRPSDAAAPGRVTNWEAFMRRFIALAMWAAAFAIGVEPMAVASPVASPYRLEILAQVGDVIDGRTIFDFDFEQTSLAINNDREVAFFASVNGPGPESFGVMTQRRFIAGAGKIVDGRIPYLRDEQQPVDINDSGQVVYTAAFIGGHTALFVNQDLILESGDVVQGQTLEQFGPTAQINDAGEVVFDTFFMNRSGHSVFSPARVVAEPGQIADGYSLNDPLYPRIGNNGQVAFLSGLAGFATFAVVTPDHVVLKPGDVIDGEVVEQIHGLGNITDAGEIVMIVRAGAWPSVYYVVATQDHVLFRPGDVIDGQTVAALAETHSVLNNRGDLALLGWIPDAERSAFRVALFAGGQRIATEGDVLNGKIISSFDPVFDMNDRGDVAFRVEFADGSRAVLLATVPEPSTCKLALTAAFALVIVRWFSYAVRRTGHPGRPADARSCGFCNGGLTEGQRWR